MLTSKQRAALRSLANPMPTIFQIGKGGINDNFIKQLNDALEARELVKVRILDTAFLDVKETANEVAKLVGGEPVQAIGSRFVIYKESKDNKQIKI